MMPGMIMLWYGSIATIPSGWHLCDGTLNTPDLRYKFVYGAAAEGHVGDVGGGTTHVHTFTGDGHLHVLDVGTGIAAGADRALYTETDPAVGTTDLADHKPPYRYLCYIMKLPIP